MHSEKLLRAISRLALYAFWPAIALVAWGELSSNRAAAALDGLFWDKSLHFAAYFGLSGMVCLALKEGRRVLAAAISLILLGGALEILQGFTGRDPDLFDALANAIGVITGSGMGYAIIGLLTPKPSTAEPH